MAIEKKILKSKPICKVTFSVEVPEAKDVKLVGDFNDWSLESHPMKKFKDGTFKSTIDLKSNTQYEFKYVIDGKYINDESADDLVFNDYSGDQNSVVIV